MLSNQPKITMFKLCKLEYLVLLFSLLSAVILIMPDLPILNRFPDWYFRKIDVGLEELNQFDDSSKVGPHRSVINNGEESFLPLLGILRTYFHDKFADHEDQTVNAIISDTGIAVGIDSEATPSPVGIWFEGEPRTTEITSMLELRILAHDFKQRTLNKSAFLFLVLSISLEIVNIRRSNKINV